MTCLSLDPPSIPPLSCVLTYGSSRANQNNSKLNPTFWIVSLPEQVSLQSALPPSPARRATVGELGSSHPKLDPLWSHPASTPLPSYSVSRGARDCYSRCILSGSVQIDRVCLTACTIGASLIRSIFGPQRTNPVLRISQVQTSQGASLPIPLTPLG